MLWNKRFAVERSRNQPAALCLNNFAMILTAHIHIAATRHHKGDIAKSGHEVFHQEIDVASITHLQSCKLQAKTCGWNDEETKARFRECTQTVVSNTCYAHNAWASFMICNMNDYVVSHHVYEQFYYNHWIKCKPMSYCSLLVCLSYVYLVSQFHVHYFKC